MTGATFYKNVTVAGGPAQVRAYIDKLLRDVLGGKFSRAASSIAPSDSMKCGTATARWTIEKRSR
jgi:hypothetical protein